MPRQSPQAAYAAELMARDRGDLPQPSAQQEVHVDGVRYEIDLGRFLNRFRHAGLSKYPDAVLIDALKKHGGKIEQKNDSQKWFVTNLSEAVQDFKDAPYVAALNARAPGNLPKLKEGLEKVLLDDGSSKDVNLGAWLHNIRNQGREKLGQAAISALERHSENVYRSQETGRWKLLPTRIKMTWHDSDYAAALRTRPQFDLPSQHQKDTLTLDGIEFNIPTGSFLHELRHRPRKKPVEDDLAAVLEWHGLRLDEATRKWLPSNSGHDRSDLVGNPLDVRLADLQPPLEESNYASSYSQGLPRTQSAGSQQATQKRK
ncbi:hypothetical protein ACJ6WF_18345 [Streptomyces sp. MMS24-I2-30]|uniref:hypothetical protein n=1 Tax=Streptomyces sp. MMS24-I2-30 TaxID=3351564 RepID=UPI003896DE91